MARGFHTLAERRASTRRGCGRPAPGGQILQTLQIGELWKSQGMKVVTNTPGQFAQRMRADYEKYGRIVKTVGITPE